MAIQIEKKDGSIKLYEQVHERLSKFREDYPVTSGWSITSEIIVNDDRRVAIVTRIINPEGNVIADGYAEEVRGSNDVNKTSAMENCETSSLGRALFKAGYGNGEICSAEELVSALKAQEALKNAKIRPVQNESNQTPNPGNPNPNANAQSATQGDPAQNRRANASKPESAQLANLDPQVINLFKRAGYAPIANDGVNYVFDGKLLIIHGPKTSQYKARYRKAGFGWDPDKKIWSKAV